MKQQIENIIKKNLPEKKEAGLYITSKATGGDIINYNREDNDDKRDGFNQAISQINTSLIADEVLKVVVEKIREEQWTLISGELTNYQKIHNQALDDLLFNLSTNKENKNNENI